MKESFLLEKRNMALTKKQEEILAVKGFKRNLKSKGFKERGVVNNAWGKVADYLGVDYMENFSPG